MVEAILALIEQALCASEKYDHCVLLSGSDYPLRSKEYLHSFFDRNSDTQFISIAKVPSAEAGISLSKIDTLSVPSNRPILKFAAKACARLGLARRNHRKHLGTVQPYGGSTWWALTRDACQYILDFVKENPSICRYFKYTYTSDETFFHTILGNSVFAPRIRRSLMYDDWSAGAPHPEMISDKHVAFFEAHENVGLNDAFGPGELLFARKFSDESAKLVARINKMMTLKDQRFGVM